MTIQEALAWYNVIFYVAIILGMAFVFVSTLGLGADGDADLDGDGELDMEVETDGHGESDIFQKVLSLFGVGRCPLSIVIFSALLIFGGTGVILNFIFAPMLAWVSVVGATVSMLFLTRFVAVTVSAFMPNTETYAIEPEHLIGTTGKVVIAVSTTFGKVVVRDHHGSLHTLDARAYSGTHPVGKRVLVVEHKDKVFYVDDNPQEIN